ncbi:MAG: endolytic transglycosylase MltG [Propionibacteriaceae bacterium]|jgi:UPF0755 protein|nr:endolytic transglycosylase MltG [Propionibacteriaceae bacterium]
MAKNDLSWIHSEASRRAKSALAVALSFAILLGSAGFVAWKGYEYYMDWRQQEDYIGEGRDSVQVRIPKGASPGQVADLCVAANVIKDARVFEQTFAEMEQAADTNGQTKPMFQYGTYNLKTELPAATAIAMLLDPANRVISRITIPEGLRWTEIASIISEKGHVSGLLVDDLYASIQLDPSIIGLNPAAGNNPEGFLFPDTYVVDDPVDPSDLLTQMTKEFDDVAADLDLTGKAAALGITPYQAVIIASIIEKEVFRDEDRPKAARVIYNRLFVQDPPMRLQMDSTVNYGLSRTGLANLDEAALATDTPYNTYLHDGLPPTPISNPGREALEAALNPAEGDWLFWVTVNLTTGETKFASTLEEHEAYVVEYQQWCSAHIDDGECPT